MLNGWEERYNPEVVLLRFLVAYGNSHAGIPEAATYCATKFAIRGLTQSAGTTDLWIVSCDVVYFLQPALEYGKHGITVNAYAPGAIETPFRMPRACANHPNLADHSLCFS